MSAILGVENSFRTQAFMMSVARVISAILNIGIPIVIVRVLDQTTFGYYKQIFLISSTMVGILVLGLPASLYFFVPRFPERSQRFVTQTALLLLLLGIFAALCLVLGTSFVENLFHAPLGKYVFIIAIFTALSLPSSLLQVVLMVDRRSNLAVLTTVSCEVVHAIFVISLALLTKNLSWILIGATASMAVQTSVVIIYVAQRGPVGGWFTGCALLKEQLAYVIPFAAASVVGILRTQLHSYVVGSRFSAAEFAVYAVGTMSIPLVGYVSQTVAEMLIIETVDKSTRGRENDIKTLWHKSTLTLAILMFPIFAISEVFARDLIVVLYGIEYELATVIIRINLLYLPLSILITSAMLRATKQLGIMLVADIAALLATIAFLFISIERFGLLGAVASLVVGNIAFMAVTSAKVMKSISLRLSTLLKWAELFKILCVACIAAVVSHLLLLSLPCTMRLVLGGLLSCLLYGASLWFFNLCPAEDKALLQKLFNKWRKKS